MKTSIIIIGAGAGGIGAALSLAENYKVTLIEKHTLGSGASGRNPGRMGHGFHYTDVETALAYLHASIKVQKAYPGFLLDEHNPDSPLRHGRYFIMKDSKPGPDEILHCWNQIQKEYTRLVAEDPTNAVFGAPEQFFRILAREEYQDEVNMERVLLGVETNESIFCWNDFCVYIKSVIKQHPNIELLEHTSVERIARKKQGAIRFSLELIQEGKPVQMDADYIVNSTWEHIERLNDQIGIPFDEKQRTNRLKTLLVASIPPELHNKNSMFFCMGQFGMMTNMGNGTVMATYAKVTNMETSTGLALSSEAQRLLEFGATPAELENYGQQMIKGLSEFIPAMAGAKVQNIRFGIVQTEGMLSLDQLTDPLHSFNKRSDHGVRQEQIGLVSNPCRKLFYFIDNGELVSEIIVKQIQITQQIDEAIDFIKAQSQSHYYCLHPKEERQLREHLERKPIDSLTADYLEDFIQDALKQMTTNKAFLAQNMFQEKRGAASIHMPEPPQPTR